MGRRLTADVQALRDLGVGQSRPQQCEHLPLSHGQRSRPLGTGARDDSHPAEERGDPVSLPGSAQTLESGQGEASVVDSGIGFTGSQGPGKLEPGTGYLQRQLQR